MLEKPGHWTMRKKERKIIRLLNFGAGGGCWSFLGQRKEPTSNVSILEQIGSAVSVDNVFMKQKLLYFGHVVRANGLEKSIMLGMGQGKRGRGRQRMRWLHEVQTNMGSTFYSLMNEAEDRCHWRRRIMEVTRCRSRPDGTR